MRVNGLLRNGLLLAIVAIMSATVVTGQQNKYSRNQVGNIIANLERSSDAFRSDFDRNLSRSSINGTSEANRISRIVADYEAALDQLRYEFDRNDNWWQSRRNVRRVMDEARAVNAMMNSLSFANKLENKWRNMRRDINTLADAYELEGIGSGAGNAPDWAVGMFSGRNPQTGGNITLNVASDGSVRITMENGSILNATMRDGRLYNGEYVSRVSRIENGIRTTDVDDTSYYIDYIRTGSTIGGAGNAPDWAVGTFSGRNPQTGGSITLNITADGRVTITSENGSVSYASMRDQRLYNGPYVSRVTKIKNGIRTTDTSNTSYYIDYFRIDGGSVNTGNVPSWAVGTFIGRNPQTGGPITLNILANGQVTITSETGSISNATIRDERLYNGPYVSRVTRISNGIRTTDVNNSSNYIDYIRNDSGLGGGGNAPGWAVGTFTGRNPQTGGSITLTITADGRVTITYENGSVSYATMRDERLYNGPYVSKVTKIRNGIRTTDVNDVSNYIEYFRR